ncbi:hypothetical protein BS50DRAFT_323542 [Corynespora cassiicola Philippines]|uniref:Uncharacterized protein n=1 Tax=Corynespora cassiicola Philippines TaxID=1448308 RepID=A0A2T2NTG4_CORCC|nr:hypothetical protein BS50DRAFT_323542 [Corynespora cassiicola Philippines]
MGATNDAVRADLRLDPASIAACKGLGQRPVALSWDTRHGMPWHATEPSGCAFATTPATPAVTCAPSVGEPSLLPHTETCLSRGAKGETMAAAIETSRNAPRLSTRVFWASCHVAVVGATAMVPFGCLAGTEKLASTSWYMQRGEKQSLVTTKSERDIHQWPAGHRRRRCKHICRSSIAASPAQKTPGSECS